MARQVLARAQRILVPLAVAMLVLTGVTGCSPEIRGVTGLTVDADRRPLAAMAWCADRPPDVVMLFAEKGSRSQDSPGAAKQSPSWPTWPGRKYAVPNDVASPTTVPLPDFPPEADPGSAFRMYAVAEDNRFTTYGVDFRLSDLAGLKPGSILITVTEDGVTEQRSVSLEKFTRRGKLPC